MTITAISAWDEGIDVLVDLMDHEVLLFETPDLNGNKYGAVKVAQFDLTIKEALALADKLTNAANVSMELQRSIETYEGV